MSPSGHQLLVLRVQAAGKPVAESRLELERAKGHPGELLQRVDEAAAKLLPGARHIRATFFDDEGQLRTLERSRIPKAVELADSLGDESRVLLVTVQEAASAPARPPQDGPTRMKARPIALGRCHVLVVDAEEDELLLPGGTHALERRAWWPQGGDDAEALRREVREARAQAEEAATEAAAVASAEVRAAQAVSARRGTEVEELRAQLEAQRAAEESKVEQASEALAHELLGMHERVEAAEEASRQQQAQNQRQALESRAIVENLLEARDQEVSHLHEEVRHERAFSQKNVDRARLELQEQSAQTAAIQGEADALRRALEQTKDERRGFEESAAKAARAEVEDAEARFQEDRSAAATQAEEVLRAALEAAGKESEDLTRCFESKLAGLRKSHNAASEELRVQLEAQRAAEESAACAAKAARAELEDAEARFEEGRSAAAAQAEEVLRAALEEADDMKRCFESKIAGLRKSHSADTQRLQASEQQLAAAERRLADEAQAAEAVVAQSEVDKQRLQASEQLLAAAERKLADEAQAAEAVVAQSEVDKQRLQASEQLLAAAERKLADEAQAAEAVVAQCDVDRQRLEQLLAAAERKLADDAQAAETVVAQRQVDKQRLQALEQRLAAAERRLADEAQSAETVVAAPSPPLASAKVLRIETSAIGVEAVEDADTRGEMDSGTRLAAVLLAAGARQVFRVGRFCIEGAAEPVPVVVGVSLQNDGAAPWPETACVVHHSGDNLGLALLMLAPARPGEAVALRMDLTVPPRSAGGPSAWVLRDAATHAPMGPALVFETMPRE